MNKLRNILYILLCLISVIAAGCLLWFLCLGNSTPARETVSGGMELAMSDRYDMQMNNTLSNALDGIMSIKKVYWLSDDDKVAPEPNPAYYGTTDDPSSLQWLLDQAEDLLEGQEMYFSTETKLIPKTKLTYYLDETILALTWKEKINGMTFTISEVKIADASQFRRFLAGGEFGSAVQMTTSEMAKSVNAVVAMSGDFYKYRRLGVITYDGKVMRFEGENLDSCYVDDKGDLLFTYRKELKSKKDAQAFVDQNNVRFSFAFGPVLIDNGEKVKVGGYPIGEIGDRYSRGGIGQMGERHYILTTVNYQYFNKVPNIKEFANAVAKFGCDKFYTLDGGQTATIVMNDKVINQVDYGSQRKISDIIYFATAIPD